MARPFRICIVLASAFMLFAPAASGAAEEYVLSISPYNYGVVFISGNLTATATYDCPRVYFHHSYELFWPKFKAGFPCIHLFNDTDADGRFQANETLYTCYLDDYHTAWTIIEPVLDVDPTLGQYAEFGMRSTVSLYGEPTNMTVLVNDWSNVTFWFRVVENGEVFTNSLGNFIVQGKTEMRMNVSIEFLNKTACSGIVMDQELEGGAETNMFLLRELISPSEENLTMVSSRVDETADGLNTTHHFRETSQPRQEARISKDDWTARAYYFWNSEVNLTHAGDAQRWMPVNSTYFTTGTTFVLQSVYPCGNETTALCTDMSIGLFDVVEEISARDWLEDNLTTLMIVAAFIAIVITLSAVYVRWIRHKGPAPSPPETQNEPDEENPR